MAGLRALVAAVLPLAVSACSLFGADITFNTLLGEPLSMRAGRRPAAAARAARAGGIAAAALAPDAGVSATALFRLARPVAIANGQSVVIDVDGPLHPFTVELYTDDEQIAWMEQVLIRGHGPFRYHLMPGAPLELAAVKLRARNGAAPGDTVAAGGGYLTLRGAGAAGRTARLYVDDGRLISGSGFAARQAPRFDGHSLAALDIGLADWVFPERASWLLTLRLGAAQPDAAPGAAGAATPIIIEVGAGTTQRRFLLRRRRANAAADIQYAHLHSADLGFRPQWIRVGNESSGPAGVESLTIEPLPPPPQAEQLVAIPLDAEALLELPRDSWRLADLELFAWSAPGSTTPPILVFDTADYAVQAQLFRRLAFFAEKRGYRGTVLDDAALGNRRGYNAHDYAAADLARFYNLAASNAVELTDHERILRDILATHGVIVAAGSQWQPGAGAVLSISRQSASYLRRILLRHELLHGLYFIYPGYRTAVEAVWQSLSADERRFWRELLGAIGYDTEYQLLLENEMQAYVLQQPRAELAGWLRLWQGRLARRLAPANTAAASAAPQWLREVTSATDRWSEIYARLDDELASATGLRADQLSLLTRLAD